MVYLNIRYHRCKKKRTLSRRIDTTLRCVQDSNTDTNRNVYHEVVNIVKGITILIGQYKANEFAHCQILPFIVTFITF